VIAGLHHQQADPDRSLLYLAAILFQLSAGHSTQHLIAALPL
jgi:hypothetical protein